jgi:hypothetical protein
MSDFCGLTRQVYLNPIGEFSPGSIQTGWRWVMQHIVRRAQWAAAVVIMMASPIVLILLVPLVAGLAFDVANVQIERSIVLLLSGPAGIALLRRIARQLPLGQAAAV